VQGSCWSSQAKLIRYRLPGSKESSSAADGRAAEAWLLRGLLQHCLSGGLMLGPASDRPSSTRAGARWRIPTGRTRCGHRPLRREPPPRSGPERRVPAVHAVPGKPRVAAAGHRCFPVRRRPATGADQGEAPAASKPCGTRQAAASSKACGSVSTSGGSGNVWARQQMLDFG
jgi:hypothetical protein